MTKRKITILGPRVKDWRDEAIWTHEKSQVSHFTLAVSEVSTKFSRDPISKLQTSYQLTFMGNPLEATPVFELQKRKEGRGTNLG